MGQLEASDRYSERSIQQSTLYSAGSTPLISHLDVHYTCTDDSGP